MPLMHACMRACINESVDVSMHDEKDFIMYSWVDGCLDG